MHITTLIMTPNIRKHVVGTDMNGIVGNPLYPNHVTVKIKFAMKVNRPFN